MVERELADARRRGVSGCGVDARLGGGHDDGTLGGVPEDAPVQMVSRVRLEQPGVAALRADLEQLGDLVRLADGAFRLVADPGDRMAVPGLPRAVTVISALVRAWRAAIRRTAMARDTDRVAGIPSGTSATMTPRANTKLSTSPAEVVAARSPKTSTASATATTDTCLAIRLTLRCSGLATSVTWANVMTEAPSSTRAKRLVNCARTFPISGGRLAARSSLGPSAASRDAALAAVRPCGELSSASKTSAGGLAEMLPAVAGRAGRTGPCRAVTGAGASVVTFDDGNNGTCQAGRILPNSA